TPPLPPTRHERAISWQRAPGNLSSSNCRDSSPIFAYDCSAVTACAGPTSSAYLPSISALAANVQFRGKRRQELASTRMGNEGRSGRTWGAGLEGWDGGPPVPDILWTTRFLITSRPYQNVFSELGTTFASSVITFPTVCAHILGRGLRFFGEDRIVFGSDSV